MGLESNVKRQLSLLLSSVNKHIVGPEVSCHDGELYHRFKVTIYDTTHRRGNYYIYECCLLLAINANDIRSCCTSHVG